MSLPPPMPEFAGSVIRPPGKLAGIEGLRGIAAIAVVLCHAVTHVDQAFGAPGLLRLFRPGHSGVDLFFVLSGFIIMLVHRVDIGRPERLARYAWRRFARVWPVYWVALTLTLAMIFAGHHAMPSPGWIAWCATLLPTTDEPILGIAWTLHYEAVFYLLFALLLIDRRLGSIAFGLWLAAILGVAAIGTSGPPAVGSFAIEFFFGMGAALLVQANRVPRPMLVATAGAVLFASAWSLESIGLLDGYHTLARLAYGLPAALIVVGVAAGEARRCAQIIRPIALLGAASYSIYLFHLAGIGIVWQMLTRLGITMQPGLWLIVLSGGGIMLGIIANRVVERPLLARLRGPVKR